jgi:hypothetical protein
VTRDWADAGTTRAFLVRWRRTDRAEIEILRDQRVRNYKIDSITGWNTPGPLPLPIDANLPLPPVYQGWGHCGLGMCFARISLAPLCAGSGWKANTRKFCLHLYSKDLIRWNLFQGSAENRDLKRDWGGTTSADIPWTSVQDQAGLVIMKFGSWQNAALKKTRAPELSQHDTKFHPLLPNKF